MMESIEWIEGTNIGYRMGVDGFYVFCTPVNVIDTYLYFSQLGGHRTSCWEYMVAFLILETMMVGMFCALDILVFYIFFEGVLIPMFIIIGVWGGARRVYASFKFFCILC